MSETLYIVKVDLVGKCPHCSEAALGTFDSDENETETREGFKIVTLTCVNCHKESDWSFSHILWCDEEER